MKKCKPLIFGILISIILGSTGCVKEVGYKFTEYGVEHAPIGVNIQSDSNFIQNEDIQFTWVLENISDDMINYKGTPFVELYLVDDKGNYIDGVPNIYDDYALGGDFKTGKINEGVKSFGNINKGEYTLEIKASWLNVNGTEVEDINESVTINIGK